MRELGSDGIFCPPRRCAYGCSHSPFAHSNSIHSSNATASKDWRRIYIRTGGFVIVISALRMELVDPRESTYTKTRGLWRFTDTLQSTSIEQNSGRLFTYVPPSCVLVYPYTSHYGRSSQQR